MAQWVQRAVAAVALALAIGLSAAAVHARPLPADADAVVQWVVQTGDHGLAPFMVVDKREARVWVFDGQGRALGNSPVLLGLAIGDDTVPGIGDRPMSAIREHERTTPAGRFVVEPGVNLSGEDILWVDYDAAVSMHRVRANNPRERRLQRLASPTPDDNRISYGCINVPTAFYDGVLSPVFTRTRGTVYVLPEVHALDSVFPLSSP